MFSRKTSRAQKEMHPQLHNLPKRSSLMCLPENNLAIRTSRTPPPRAKLSKDKRSLSMESIFPENAATHNNNNNNNNNSSSEYFTDQMDAITWSESFARLLANRTGVETFLSYLETEHSAENIRFWVECQKYKRASGEGGGVEEMARKARYLYEEYLCDTGRYQVNVDSARLKEIEGVLDKPNMWTFDEVQNDIFLLMKRDSYPRFLKSDRYKNIVNGSNNNNNCFHGDAGGGK